MTSIDWLLFSLAVSGWAGTFFFCVLWRCDPRAKSPVSTFVYLTSGDVVSKRVQLLRKTGLALLEEGARDFKNGYTRSAKLEEDKGRAMLAEADQLDPPVPPGGAPGHLSLVKGDDPK
jgi:hypothetical protein